MVLWKKSSETWCVCLAAQSCLTLCDPMDYSRPGSSVHEFPRQGCWSGLPFPSPGDLHNPGTEPGPPALHTDSLPIEPPGKPEYCLLLILNNLIAQKILTIL